MNPVPKTPVVEIVRGLKTSEDTYQTIRQFALQLKKTPIEVYEYPGYVTTRIILPMLNEAMYVLMEGVASAEDIDTALKLGYNMDRGPLALADQMGLDEVMTWMESLFRELGDLKYRPCPLLRKMVRAGHLGRKTGKGFFYYDEHGRRIQKGTPE
jgi:3-hydroxybutyryl-CoA dehydrogenase